MNWADYQVGRRVVCIADFTAGKKFCSIVPDRGKVYTIRATVLGDSLENEQTLGLAFYEFCSVGFPDAHMQPTAGEWFFGVNSFKPLDERRLDQFRQMLTKIPSPWDHDKDRSRVDA